MLDGSVVCGGTNLKGKQGKDTKFYEKELRDPSFVYTFLLTSQTLETPHRKALA